MNIYLPEEYLDNCNVINNGYIRSYLNDNYTSWHDIYVNQDYQIKEGYSNYGQNPVCDSTNIYTSNIWYRLDIDKILFIFLTIAFVIYFIISSLFKRLFRGRKIY